MQTKANPESTESPNVFIKFYDHVLDLGKSIGMFLIFFAIISICAHVFSRYFLNKPLNFVIDVAMLSLFYITFLSTAWLLREDGHVSLDFLKYSLSRRSYSIIEIINNIICALVCLILTYVGILETINAYRTDVYIVMQTPFPKWLVLAGVPFGLFLLSVEFFRKVVISIRDRQKPGK